VLEELMTKADAYRIKRFKGLYGLLVGMTREEREKIQSEMYAAITHMSSNMSSSINNKPDKERVEKVMRNNLFNLGLLPTSTASSSSSSSTASTSSLSTSDTSITVSAPLIDDEKVCASFLSYFTPA
jgi:hypothetical protein